MRRVSDWKSVRIGAIPVLPKRLYIILPLPKSSLLCESLKRTWEQNQVPAAIFKRVYKFFHNTGIMKIIKGRNYEKIEGTRQFSNLFFASILIQIEI